MKQPSTWRPTAADAGRYFDQEAVDRGKAYQRPRQRTNLLFSIALVATLVGLVWARFAPEFQSRAGIDPWPLELIAIIALVTVLCSLPGIPAAVWLEFVHEKKWGFSTQTARGFIADQFKDAFVYGVILLSAMFVPVWAFMRATELWWFWGSVAMFGVILIFAAIYPIWIMPLFNKFTPLDDEALVERLQALAERGGVKIKDFLVMDASKRSRKDNAFFAGIGKTRRVVLFDNILELPHECIEIVVAHELGHWRRRHTMKNVVVGALRLPLLLGFTALVVTWDPALRWAGVESVAQPTALPLFLLTFGAAQSAVSRSSAWLSRAFERQADAEALELVRDLDAFTDTWRRMVDRNLPDLTPSWWARSKLSHPPVVERIAFGEAWAAANPEQLAPLPVG